MNTHCRTSMEPSVPFVNLAEFHQRGICPKKVPQLLIVLLLLLVVSLMMMF